MKMRRREKKAVGNVQSEEECQLNAKRKEMQEKGQKGNLWVKTCFLVKGLSPSKLSTKALCGDTRKRGNEKPEGI